MSWAGPQITELPGQRLHLQHGPIDLVIKAEGTDGDLRIAYAAACRRFETVLGELAGELDLLRRPLVQAYPEPGTPVARRMVAACWPHRDVFITPMAAVAGSVADEIRDAMLSASPALHSLYVNNGGDIALHVAPGATLRIGLVPDLASARPEGVITLTGKDGIGGIATSGWRGRSFSLGVADAVTVLAERAATADAAATIIANAVNVDSASVSRAPARSLDPDSDLGDILVTTQVRALSDIELATALHRGADTARSLRDKGLIAGSLIVVQGRYLETGRQDLRLKPAPSF